MNRLQVVTGRESFLASFSLAFSLLLLCFNASEAGAFLGFPRASFVLRLEIAANLSGIPTGYGPPFLNTGIRYNTRHETGKPARECLHLYAFPRIKADRNVMFCKVVRRSEFRFY